MPSIPSDRPDNDLLTPRQVAELFGVRVATISLWSRTGKLTNDVTTPGGHRRYRWGTVRALLQTKSPAHDPAQEQLEIDAARLYEQGWSIRQVAENFGYDYGAMRRLLLRRMTLRRR